MRILLQMVAPGLMLALSILVGCMPEREQTQVLRIAINDNPTNLDARTHTDAVSYRIIELVYDFLVRMDSTGLPELGVASRVDTLADTAFAFTLREDVRFHDGARLSAHDVAYTFNSILDPELNAPLRSTLQSVLRRIEVVDSFRIEFYLREPHAPFFSHLQVGIVPRHLALTGDLDLKRTPIGSGPFRLVQWEADSFIELEANRAYWGGAPRLEGILIKILPEATTRVLALQNEEIDLLINNFPETQVDAFREKPGFRTMVSSGFNYEYLGLNLRTAQFQDIRVRHAIAHAINIPMLIKSLEGGLPTPAHSLLSRKHWAYYPDLPGYEHNPEEARRLLDEAGYPDPDGDGPQTRFSLAYKCTDKQASRQKAQTIQQFLREVGIAVEISSNEWGTFYDDISNGRFDLFSLQIVGIYEPDVYRLFFVSDEPRNRFGYRNPEVDEAVRAAALTTSNQSRRVLYGKVQRILQQELPCISLWHKANIAVMDRRLRGLEMYPTGEWRSFQKVYFDFDSNSN